MGMKDIIKKLTNKVSNASDEAHRKNPVKWGDYFDNALDKGLNLISEPSDKDITEDFTNTFESSFNKSDFDDVTNATKKFGDSLDIDAKKVELESLKDFGFNNEYDAESIANGTFNSEQYLKDQGVRTINIDKPEKFIPSDFNAESMANSMTLKTESAEPSFKLPDITKFMSGSMKKIPVSNLKNEDNKSFSFDASKYTDKIKGYSKYINIDEILGFAGIDKAQLKNDLGNIGDSLKNFGSVKSGDINAFNFANLEDFDPSVIGNPDLNSFSLSDAYEGVPELEIPPEYEGPEFESTNLSSLLNSGMDFKTQFNVNSLGKGMEITPPNLESEMPNQLKIDFSNYGNDFSMDLKTEINKIRNQI